MPASQSVPGPSTAGRAIARSITVVILLMESAASSKSGYNFNCEDDLSQLCGEMGLQGFLYAA